MSKEDADKEMGDLFKSVGGWIASVISFISVLVGFVTLFQGEGKIGFLTGILLTVGIGSLLLICGFIYFKKVTIGESVGFPTKRPAYSKTSRRLALAGLFSIPMLVILSFAGWQYYQSLPPDKIIVLVANFDGSEPKKHGLTERLIEDLNSVTTRAGYKDVEIQPLNQVITIQQGDRVARSRGKENKATIVVWGWYPNPGVQPVLHLHIEILSKTETKKSIYQIKQFKLEELRSIEIPAPVFFDIHYITLLTVGLVRYEAGDLDGAINSFTELLTQGIVPEKVPQQAIYFYRGNANYALGNYLNAIEDYKQALKFKADFVQAYNNLGNVYAKQEEYELAIQNYNLAIKSKPDDADYYYNRGIVYTELEKYDLAIQDYDRAIKLNPDFAEAYNNLGLIYDQKDQPNLAITNFKKAIDRNSKLTETYNNLGSVYYKQGKHKLAIENYDKAIKQNRRFIKVYYNRGLAHSSLGKYKRAINDYTQVIKQKPYFLIKAYHNRGDVYAQQGDYERAIADNEAVLDLKPNDAQAAVVYNNIGFYYGKQGKYDLALTNINQAISLDPNLEQAYDSRGFVYDEQGKYNLAIADFNRALQLNSNLPSTYLKRGCVYKVTGKKKRAEADFKKVLDLTKDRKLRQQATKQICK